MSSDKLAVFIVLGIIGLIGVGVLIYMFFIKKKAVSVENVFKNAEDNLKKPVQAEIKLNDEQFSMFIAGVFTSVSLKKEYFKKIVGLKEEKDEDKKNTKTSLDNFEKVRSSLEKFLKLKDEAEIKKSFKETKQLESLKELALGNSKVDVTKKDNDPLKNIIERIQKENDKKKEIFTKKVTDKDYNIVEGVVCGVTEIFKGCIESSA